ncbi:MAG TPA: hypothetical protein VK724_05920 [Bryobacteraceae bacterium]|jgi:hypothetical protein|nr:hypothetical protein [Bryobacteraceae bacterium]
MRGMTPLVCVILLFSAASCNRRPTDKRVDIKTALLPEIAADDKAFSAYQPTNAYAASANGLLERTVFQADTAPGTHIDVRDWKLPPGKQTSAITLPGAAFIEVRSGSGTLMSGAQTQQLPLGAFVSVSQDQSFTITNSGQLVLTMRVYVVTGR